MRPSKSDAQYVCAQCGTTFTEDTWLGHVNETHHPVWHSSTIPGLVPRSVADALALELEDLDGRVYLGTRELLAWYRAAYPREETP